MSNVLSAQRRILLETIPRNTTSAIALESFTAQAEGGDPLLLVLPSDHTIQDTRVFAEEVNAASVLARNSNIVTFGILPMLRKPTSAISDRVSP